MSSAKDILLRRIDARFAANFIRAHHYSGKVVQNSSLHFGVFLPDSKTCLGAMSFGPPLDKSKVLGLVAGTRWDGVVELNRMAFHDVLPRNSESRAIAVAMKLLKRHAPAVEWCLSYADATQCGDGTIYRAAGFLLTGVKRNKNLAQIGDKVMHKMTLESSPTKPLSFAGGRSYFEVTGGRYDWAGFVKELGGRTLDGFQLRYLKILHPGAVARLTVKPLPYRTIEELGAKMYKGARSRDDAAPCDQ